NQLSYLATVRRHGFICRRRERAAYKKSLRGMSSKPGWSFKSLSSLWQISRYLGRIAGSPPAGGHSTPSDCASLSPNGACAWPTVAPFGAILPCGVVCVGAQPVARSGADGAVCAGGVAGTGGACAAAAPDI